MIQLLVSIQNTKRVYYFIIKTFYLLGNDDYDSGPYIVTFPSGVTNASFNVTIIDNDQYESTETFYLIINSFSLPHNMYISNPGHAIVIISDDDCECNYVLLYSRVDGLNSWDTRLINI